ncbi:MAG: hypothetical protein IT343_01680 [Candidatus Melainabacteria bacterium]|nr:hypothetical protein [Candidatus Melainabacteria bacterium]
MTADIIVLAPKELHPIIEISLAQYGCSTIEQYAEKQGHEAAARLAASSRALSSPAGKWAPPWCEDDRECRGIGTSLYHWWIDCLGFFEEITGMDSQELAAHWDEILDFVRRFESN